MEICKVKISKETLQLLVDSDALSTEDFEVIGVDELSFDYSQNEAWVLQKQKSDKAFKELKKIEFKIRNGI